jgi:hypothetical protein
VLAQDAERAVLRVDEDRARAALENGGEMNGTVSNFVRVKDLPVQRRRDKTKLETKRSRIFKKKSEG